MRYTKKVHKAIREIKSQGSKDINVITKVCKKYGLIPENIIRVGQFKLEDSVVDDY